MNPSFRSSQRLCPIGALRCLALGCLLITLSLGAATPGSNHPATGAYAPVNAAAWGTATWPLGASFTDGSGSTLQVAVYSGNATRLILEIYLSSTGVDAAYDYTMVKGADNIWRASVANAPANTLYAFRAWGPNWTYDAAWTRGNSNAGFKADFDSLGNRFNPNKVLFDPYARELSHSRDGIAMANAGENGGMYGTGGTDVASNETYKGAITNNIAISRRNVDTGRYAPKAVAIVDRTPTGSRPDISQQDAVIYETHVKALTAHPSSVNLTTLLSSYSGFQDAANVPDNLRGTYAGAAYMAGYLRDLGFNTVEFLPVHETNNETSPTNKAGGNYWAYWTYGFFAPDRRYAHDQSFGGPTAEFKKMVAAFHQAGIEVYLDVVYNHSGEGGTWDSSANSAELTFFRGLDNRAYYTLSGSSNQYYYNHSGVGEDLNCGSLPMKNLVLDSLTYWNQTMGVDGFRFDLAVEMGRDGTGPFSSTAPVLTGIAALANANHFKIIAEPWDLGDGNEIGNFPAGWACWNGNYRDSVRSALLGNLGGTNGTGYADAFHGSYNQMSAQGGPQKSVNYIVCHDGFTMADQVSFSSQTQSSLLWPFGPGDGGSNDNRSSFWGGDKTLRRQAIRSYWTFEILSRGVPMLVWGDEFGRTVNGNNNAYNVDSVATWNNYAMIGTNSPQTVATGDATGGAAVYLNSLGTFSSAKNGNFAFLQYLLRLRAAHPAFRQKDYAMPITYSNADGTSGFNEFTCATPAIYVKGTQVGDDDFFLMSNFSSNAANFKVPTAPTGTHWIKLLDTNSTSESVNNCWPVATAATVSGTLSVASKALVLLEAVPNLFAPVLTSQPVSQTLAPAGNVTFTATATGATSYQWFKDGIALSGATSSTLALTNVSSADNGSYTLVATNAAGSTTSAKAVLLVDTPAPGRLTNLSVRSFAGVSDQTLIAGYGLSGSGTHPLLIRAIGPTLSVFKVPGVLSDPQLWIYDGPTAIASNDNWGGATELATTFSQVGAFALAGDSLDAALTTAPSIGSYTAQVAGNGGGTGVALVELYDADSASATSRLINISARTEVGLTDNILIAGFYISGNVPRQLLIRGIGPSLRVFNVSGTLIDPRLRVFDNAQNKIAENDNWEDVPNDANLLKTTFTSVGAFALASGTRDAVLLLTLPPGSYTAQVSGVGNTTGVALVEVYEVPSV